MIHPREKKEKKKRLNHPSISNVKRGKKKNVRRRRSLEGHSRPTEKKGSREDDLKSEIDGEKGKRQSHREGGGGEMSDPQGGFVLRFQKKGGGVDGKEVGIKKPLSFRGGKKKGEGRLWKKRRWSKYIVPRFIIRKKKEWALLVEREEKRKIKKTQLRGGRGIGGLKEEKSGEKAFL